jgi:formyltetrahydrofolate synthetase
VVAGKPLDENLLKENVDAVQRGGVNLEKQVENMKLFGIPVVVAINKFTCDTKNEIEAVRKIAIAAGAEDAVLSEVWEKGGDGGRDLAKAVDKAANKPSNFRFLYELNLPIKEKIETIAKRIYGAGVVQYEAEAEKKIDLYTKLGYDKLPICMAKTHLSLSHDPAVKGRPDGFTLPIRDVRASIGAGFLYPLCGQMRTMPGLPSEPAGEKIDLDENGKVVGLF